MARLDVLLARNLRLSRKAVRKLLRPSVVTDEAGRILDDPAMELPEGPPIPVVVAGRPLELRFRCDLIQHKPLGVVTALSDARHPTAYALLSSWPLIDALRPVGRLDLDTAGLLLWTTDGALLHRLTHPRYGIDREYQAALARPWIPPPADLRLDDGHRPTIVALESIEAEACHPALLRPPRARALARIVLRSGRFHEVRRIFAALGSEVVGLARVRYGTTRLPPALAPGEAVAWDPDPSPTGGRG